LSRTHALCVVATEAVVRGCRPDFGGLAEVDVHGVIVTAPGTEYDFVSRYFAPRIGVDEDPVTGAAHCVLAPYWCRILGRLELIGYQASARGGLVAVHLRGDRVSLAGRAVTAKEVGLLPAPPRGL
ncbi:MAG: PhzF family phenazine biosynthesis protein, partial [Planctomycetota bacterium]|nr:PhzF family phenazine biosynthesis protein [Planctomycetota bacterium]